MRSRLEERLRRLPFPPLRDVVAKRPSSGANLDALDGVRGLAVLIVIAAHTEAFGMEGHGAVGVWLFFCLSAFLLTLPFAARPESVVAPARLRRYVARRLRRIVPAYYFFILLISATLACNLEFLWEHLLFVRADGILWTIPQEMLFYALPPPLAALHLLFRRSHPATIAALLAIALVANARLDASVFALHGNGKWLRFHLDIFALGMAFAYASHWPLLAGWLARPPVNRAIGLGGLFLLAALLLSAPAPYEALFASLPLVGGLEPPIGIRYRGTFGVLCAALVFTTIVCRGRLVERFFRSLFLRALGITSFSLYLFHVVVLQFLHGRGVEKGLPLFFATLVVTWLIASAVYIFVERPFMQVRLREVRT